MIHQIIELKIQELKKRHDALEKRIEALKQEPKSGHWKWGVDCRGTYYCKCSECGIGMGHTEYDYCPNCGVKMEREVDQ